MNLDKNHQSPAIIHPGTRNVSYFKQNVSNTHARTIGEYSKDIININVKSNLEKSSPKTEYKKRSIRPNTHSSNAYNDKSTELRSDVLGSQEINTINFDKQQHFLDTTSKNDMYIKEATIESSKS
jgi:hypothetical protein